ncbi:MAG: BREX system Lon protease-like protein BrxL [Clostridiales Family XIII bacterium]|jgi:ATP-dependent Lon protease|nr:BREX system Lon protease-like protein BrxL [Clostridiales Family XIII bacterium]
MDTLDKKLNEVFQGKTVRKDLTALLKRTANAPAYVIEFLLGMYANTTDDEALQEGLNNIRRILSENYVRPDEGEKIKSRIKENGEYTVIDKISAKFDERRDVYTGTFSNLSTEPFLIPYEYIKGYEKMLTSGIWCISRMAYDQGADSSFRVVSLKPVQMSVLDLTDFTERRKEFSFKEWRNLLLRSVGYEPTALTDIECLHLIERMVPLAERNYNLCELGPKGTGKSHIYKEISPYTILTSSGSITTANLFVNMKSGQLGLAGYWDCVALDEVSGMHLKNKETVQVFKDYMASGSYSGKNNMVNADASLVMIGNADYISEDSGSDAHLLAAFPASLRDDSAFFDRIHFYVPGWDVPKLRPELLTEHYGLNTDYLSEYCRELRKKDYGHLFDEKYDLNSHFNQRDVIAVRKTFSGLAKLLFPDMVMSDEEMRMLLEYSITGRRRVKEQLKAMDGAEFAETDLGYIDNEGNETIVNLPEVITSSFDFNDDDELEGLRDVGDSDIDFEEEEHHRLKSETTLRIENKMREIFRKKAGEEVVVLKSPERTTFFRNMGLPSYMRDWITMKFSDEYGKFDKSGAFKYVQRFLPDRKGFEKIKYQMNSGKTVRILARIRITVNIKEGTTEFELPDFGGKVNGASGLIKSTVIDKWQDILLKESENWGVIDIQRQEDSDSKKPKGIVWLVGYQRFSVYNIDLAEYRKQRRQFSISEWIDVLLTAVDYNPDGYKDERAKLYFLRRLLPFVQRNINLIELAPKGTGKTYIYQTISKRGWLQAAGTVSRASLFYNNRTREPGLLMHFDFVVFDEIQTMIFNDPTEIQSALKHYMEYGEVKGFDTQMNSDAGIVLLGNIEAAKFSTDVNMMMEINPIFSESATLDRFHGFIPGWEIPRMTQGLIADGWALSTEFFAEVAHALRGELKYSAIVDSCLEVPPKADQRDLTAIKRLTEAFLKLLFPHVESKKDISPDEFITYCLEPAKEMRRTIKKQLCIIDPDEFDTSGKRDIPDIQYRYGDAEEDENLSIQFEAAASSDSMLDETDETDGTGKKTPPTDVSNTRAKFSRYGYKDAFREDVDFFMELLDRYQEKQKIAREIIEKRFPPPQMTYDKFIQEMDSFESAFMLQINKANDIIGIASERTERIDDELTNARELAKSIVEKTEGLAIELSVNLNEVGEGSSTAEIEALMEDMQNLIESIKEYK